MPLFDYKCTACGHTFEALVLKGQEPAACTACGSAGLDKLLSLPAVKSSTTTDLAMRSAKKRDAGQAAERAHAQAQYEQSHDRHG
ncbi:MAG: zinc ribbon domain-containing protein [Gemmatimonadetes bacterium]|nr:zinc ribbon domain-containing protein [Gemmatimonadota bacterium]